MKTFNYLHQELCVILGKLIPRYRLWAAIGEHPITGLSPEQAATFLEDTEVGLLKPLREQVGERKWRKLVSKVRRFDPKHPTPEEVFSSIWDGLTRKD